MNCDVWSMMFIGMGLFKLGVFSAARSYRWRRLSGSSRRSSHPCPGPARPGVNCRRRTLTGSSVIHPNFRMSAQPFPISRRVLCPTPPADRDLLRLRRQGYRPNPAAGARRRAGSYRREGVLHLLGRLRPHDHPISASARSRPH
jgi:hypothetical protein